MAGLLMLPERECPALTIKGGCLRLADVAKFPETSQVPPLF